MCGIAGIVARNAAATDDLPCVVRRMTQAIRHRGPDGSGIKAFPGDGNAAPVVLGHRRLAIIDLTDAGLQPMCNEDETVWVVFNGEIYNFRELRAELIAKG